MTKFSALFLAVLALSACSVGETVLEAGERAPDRCWGCRNNR
ncbi:MAG: hypothetical protein AAFN79_05400 [Pseudomonadota bacterium]